MKNLLQIIRLASGLLFLATVTITPTVATAATSNMRKAPTQAANPKRTGPEYYLLPSTASLTAPELEQVKALVAMAVRRYNQRVPRRYRNLRLQPLADYGIQYRVTLDAKGKKQVWINAFCKDGIHHANLTTQEVVVFDGGSCFFNTILHLEANQAEAITIHGLA